MLIRLCLPCKIILLNFFFQSIENFIKSNDGEPIFTEQKRPNRLLPKTERKVLKLLVEFIFREYTQYPRENEVILVCKAALQLFNGLKGGIVSGKNWTNKLSWHFTWFSFCIFLGRIVWRQNEKRCFVQCRIKCTSKKSSDCRNQHLWKFFYWINRSRETGCEKLSENHRSARW